MPISSRIESHHKHPGAARESFSPAIAVLFALGGVFAAVVQYDGALPLDANHLWILGLFAALQFVLMMLCVPASSLHSKAQGFVSFDRLALTATLLLFGPILAAWSAGVVAFAFTLASNFRRENIRTLVSHALGNGGMYMLACLAAGYTWIAIGGQVPIIEFNDVNLGRIVVLIVVLQITNELLFKILFWRKGIKARQWRPMHWSVTLLEFIIAWTGVAATHSFLTLPLRGFALYLLLILVIAALLKLAVKAAEREHAQTFELAAVNRVNQAVNAATEVDTLIETIFRETQTLIPFSAFVFGLISPDDNKVDIRLNYDEGVRHSPVKRELGEGITGWVLANKESVLIADTRHSKHPCLANRRSTGTPSISVIAAPVEYQSEAVGIISLQDYHPHAFGPHQLELLQSFARQIGVAIVNLQLFTTLQTYQQQLEERVARRTKELKQTSLSLQQAMEQREELVQRLEAETRRDSLTSLANRRYLKNRLRQEHYRAKRFGHPLSIAVVDIDHFKRINDRWGHLVGDKVLTSIATLFRDGLRATDFPARYGGEEFVILFPETPLAGAVAVCEQLRARVATHPWEELADGLEVTISIGVSSNLGLMRQDIELFASADTALYRAKSEGRNRVCSPVELEPL
ncbi:MAG: sensor domain-containing diguanylate cyclase [Gammaproteobacteria bacterium]|nr:sensor domain-containing diguanylate cyclase [Gammaproteobacteria bacterium]